MWKRLPARFSIVFVLLTLLVAVFAFVIVPDKTEYANGMVVELDGKPAGFSKDFLLIPLKATPEKESRFKTIFWGHQPHFEMIPVNTYHFDGNSIVVSHYIDDEVADEQRYDFKELGLPQNTEAAQQWVQKNRITHKTFYLGTDRYGRDILSRLLVGTRVSMTVGLVSLLFSMFLGISLGAVAGWYRGFTDNTVMWLVNVLWSVPALLLVFAITLTIGKGFWEVLVAIGLTSWVSAARLIRGQVMQTKEMEYISAAKALGFPDSRIIFRHILPNIAGPIMVIGAANFASAILVEAGLSFLGFGVQPPMPSWGLMIKEHYTFLVAGNPLPALIPGLAIVLLVLAFNILGNALRDVLDVR